MLELESTERGETMIQLEKLPILTRILGILDGDATDRDHVGKTTQKPVDPGGGDDGGYHYCYCACFCSWDYRDGMFNSLLYDVGG